MSLRSHYPAPRASASHFFFTLSRGDRQRQIAMKPWLTYALMASAPLLLAGFAVCSAYVVFHDDVLSAMQNRQSDMQYAYEDKIAELRTQLDRVTSRQMVDQDTLEGRVLDLISRQAQIENRTSVITALAGQAGLASQTGVAGEETASIHGAGAGPRETPKGGANPLLANRSRSPALPPGVNAFAPTAPAPLSLGRAGRVDNKPHPEIPDQRSDLGASRARSLAALVYGEASADTRLRAVANSLEALDYAQVRALSNIGGAARRTASRLRAVIAETGLSAEQIPAPAVAPRGRSMGGPFVPFKANPNGSLFEREVYRLQNDVVEAEKLRRIVSLLPLRQPLVGSLDITSPFGGRVDPFFGRLALHTGVDLREPMGSPVRATAGGRVISAEWKGGYGNMIEIDHGNGITTRYGHLSTILVSANQSVETGWVVGKLGSTGRSTGPHLHYEVRVNGEPVDPLRFLRPGARWLASR